MGVKPKPMQPLDYQKTESSPNPINSENYGLIPFAIAFVLALVLVLAIAKEWF